MDANFIIIFAVAISPTTTGMVTDVGPESGLSEYSRFSVVFFCLFLPKLLE